MALRVKAALAAAAVLLFASTAVAWANTGITATLFSGLGDGYYGQDCMLMPQVNTETKVVPGSGLKQDKFEFQIKRNGAWEKYDDQLVEATGTVDPLVLVFDDSVKYPADLRVLFYRSAKSAGVVDYALQATSDPVRVYKLRHAVSKVAIKAPKKASSGKTFTTEYAVQPMCGAGKVKVTVERKIGGRFKTVSTKKITTDEMSTGSLKLKYKRAGTYRITAKFAGNSWAAASKAVTKTVKVK